MGRGTQGDSKVMNLSMGIVLVFDGCLQLID
jgi:hypothetical protein